jgi:hypothetical protein
MYCHTRDLVNWVVQNFVPKVTPAAISIIAPTMTVVGVLAGAFFAAMQHKEFAWRQTIHPAKAFVWGAAVSFCAALLGACTLRIIVRAAYLEPFAYVGIAAIGVGAMLSAVLFLRGMTK